MREKAQVVCETCGMPVVVVFEDGEIAEVFAVCGHVKMPTEDAIAREGS